MKKRTRKRKSKSVCKHELLWLATLELTNSDYYAKARSIEHQSDIHIRNDSSSELGPQKKRARSKFESTFFFLCFCLC